MLELNAPEGTVTTPSMVTTVPSGKLRAAAIEIVLGFDGAEWTELLVAVTKKLTRISKNRADKTLRVVEVCIRNIVSYSF